MDAPERRHRRIDARQLHRDKTVQQPAAAGGAVSLITHPSDTDFGHPRDDFERKCIPTPIILDHRRDDAFRELANTFEQRPLTLVQYGGYPVEIAFDWRRRVVRLPNWLCLLTRHHFLPSCCDWASRRPPNGQTRPPSQPANRESGDDGSTCLLPSARNASIKAAVSAGRVTMKRCPSSTIRSSAFGIKAARM